MVHLLNCSKNKYWSKNDYHSINSTISDHLVYPAFYCITSENNNSRRIWQKNSWHSIFCSRRPPNKKKNVVGYNFILLFVVNSNEPTIFYFSKLKLAFPTPARVSNYNDFKIKAF